MPAPLRLALLSIPYLSFPAKDRVTPPRPRLQPSPGVGERAHAVDPYHDAGPDMASALIAQRAFFSASTQRTSRSMPDPFDRLCTGTCPRRVDRSPPHPGRCRSGIVTRLSRIASSHRGISTTCHARPGRVIARVTYLPRDAPPNPTPVMPSRVEESLSDAHHTPAPLRWGRMACAHVSDRTSPICHHTSRPPDYSPERQDPHQGAASSAPTQVAGDDG